MARDVLSSEPTRGRLAGGNAGRSGARLDVDDRPRRDTDRLGTRVTPSALAVAVLVVLPVLVYGVPGMLGHPILPGDDLTQSLPLRELVGRDLRAGHLPIFDPYLWSGAPLLAGWNAGAAYPLTWLFAVLPAPAAWTLNIVAIGLVAGLGMFAFLRACRLGVLASFLGALTFSFGGAMSAQIQHLGLVVGMSWVPVALLAVLRLTEPDRTGWRPRLGWTSALAGAVGLVLLAGEPRAVANAAAVLTVYTLWRLARIARHAGARGGTVALDGAPLSTPAVLGWSIGAAVLGAALGFGLGAVQLLPGLAAVATSQRAAVSTFLYSAGSYPTHWLTLLGVPDLLGGSGSFGQPTYFATYNLAEVTAYVGVLPLVAAGALLARRRWRPLPEWVVWYAIGILGVLLALATHTPLWHVFIRIPLLGGQRLQSRSIMATDLALAVLLSYWVDDWIARRRATRPRRLELCFGAIPALCVAAIVVVAIVWRVPFLEWMGVGASTARAEHALGPWLLPFLVLAVAAVALLTFGTRLRRTARTLAVVMFVCVDLVVYSAMTVVLLGGGAPTTGAEVASAKLRPSPLASRAAMSTRRRTSAAGRVARRAGAATHPHVAPSIRPIATLHLPGRFAIYDPTLVDDRELTALGPNDANVVAGTYSVEGYGSIVYGPYATATGTHGVSGTGQDVFAPAAAANGVFDALDTSEVLAPSVYLAPPPGRSAPARAVGTGTRTTTAGGTATWFLGTPAEVTTATLGLSARGITAGPSGSPAVGTRDPATPAVRIGLLEPTGHLRWSAHCVRVRSATNGTRSTAAGARTASTTWRAAWTQGTRAVALVVETEASSILRAPTISTTSGSATLDGVLQSAIEAPHWVYAGTDGDFAIYRDTRAAPPLRLRAVAGHSLAGASVRRRSGPTLEPSAATVSSPHGVEVVRAVAAIPGWTAQWQPSHSQRTVPLSVRRAGVVQVVTVPPGTGVVTWRYVGPKLHEGEVLSVATAVVVTALALGAAWVARDERRRSSCVTTPPTAT